MNILNWNIWERTVGFGQNILVETFRNLGTSPHFMLSMWLQSHVSIFLSYRHCCKAV